MGIRLSLFAWSAIFSAVESGKAQIMLYVSEFLLYVALGITAFIILTNMVVEG